MEEETTTVNGELCSWSNLHVTIADQSIDIKQIAKIDYSEERSMDDVYSPTGTYQGRGYGPVISKASMTLKRDEVEKLRDKFGSTGSLLRIPPFDILVQFVKVKDGGSTVFTHLLKNCQIKKESASSKYKDETVDVVLDLAVSGIIWKGI